MAHKKHIGRHRQKDVGNRKRFMSVCGRMAWPSEIVVNLGELLELRDRGTPICQECAHQGEGVTTVFENASYEKNFHERRKWQAMGDELRP